MKKRPIFVWIISIFYLGLGFWNVSGYSFIPAGLETIVVSIVIVLYFIGAVLLLFLKKFSLPIFGLLFLVQIGYIYYFHPSEITPLIDSRYYFDIPVYISLQAASFIYVWTLNRKGVLS